MAVIKCISEEDLEALLQNEGLLTGDVFIPTTNGTFIKMATYSKVNDVCSNTFSDSEGNEYSATFNPDSNDTSQDDTSLVAGSPTITTILLSSSTIYYTLTLELTNCATSSVSSSIEEGGSISFTLTADSGYILPSSIVVDGTCTSSYDSSTGEVILTDIQSDIIITAIAEAEEVEETDAVLLYRMTFTDGNTYYYYSDGSYSDSEGGDSVGNIGYELNSYLSTKAWNDNTTLEEVYVYDETTVSLGIDGSSGLVSTNSGSNLFNGCTNLTSADLTYLDISNIEDFGYDSTESSYIDGADAFDYCTSLTDLKLNGVIFANSSHGISFYFGDSPLSYESVKYLFDNASSEINISSTEYYEPVVVFSHTTGEYLSACEVWEWANTFSLGIYICSEDGPVSDEISSNSHVTDYADRIDINNSYIGDYAIWREGENLYTSRSASGYDGTYAALAEDNYYTFKDITGVSEDTLTYYHNFYLFNGEGLLQNNTVIKYIDMTGVTLVSSTEEAETLLGDLLSTSDCYTLSSSLAYAFYGCISLEYINLCTWDTSNINSLAYMFYNCSSLETVRFAHNVNSSSWNTGNVTNMDYMFYGCSNLVEVTCPEGGLDVSGVDMNDTVFDGCTSLTTIFLKGVYMYQDASLMFDKIPLSVESINFLLNNISEISDEHEIVFATEHESEVDSDAISIAESRGWIVEFYDRD